MKLFHYEDRNFGDAMNAWLWPGLLPGILDADDSTLFLGIGTLLNHRVPESPHKVVFGTGVGYGKRLEALDDRWTVYCVRGPRSARALGLSPDLAITDPAALIRTVDLGAESAVHSVSYIPHWRSDEYWSWKSVCGEAGVNYINPRADFEDVVREIRRSEVVLTEAMHGAILADALRVPWVSVSAYKHILEFKWLDWCESLGIEYRPVRLMPLYGAEPAAAMLRAKAAKPKHGAAASLAMRAAAFGVRHASAPITSLMAARNVRALARLAREAEPQLSSDDAIGSATARLQERLEQLKADHAAGRFMQAAAVAR